MIPRHRREKILEFVRSGRWREAILRGVMAWNRNQIRLILSGVILTWLLGASASHLNPIGGEAGPLKEDDQLILVLERVSFEGSLTEGPQLDGGWIRQHL